MNKDHVALVRCYFCGESDRILLATRYNQKGEPLKDLGPLNNKVIDMDPCRKCQDWMKQGIILLGIDPEKSDPVWEKEKLPNPFRSGAFSVIKDDAFDRIFDGEGVKEFAHKHRFMFVDHKVLVMLGIVKETADEEGHSQQG